jgi:hypothetical protein
MTPPISASQLTLLIEHLLSELLLSVDDGDEVCNALPVPRTHRERPNLSCGLRARKVEKRRARATNALEAYLAKLSAMAPAEVPSATPSCSRPGSVL